MEAITMSNKAYEFVVDNKIEGATFMVLIYHNLDKTEMCLFITPDEAKALAKALIEAASGETK